MSSVNTETKNIIHLPSLDDEWTIYGACSWCSPCRKIKEFLTDKNIEFVYHPIDDCAKETINMLSDLTNNYKYIPIVFHYGKFIGGAKETIEIITK